MDKKSLSIQFFIIIAGLILFVPFLGLTHLFDWDEINFAEATREMFISKEYFNVQINFKPFWEKPPLFIWIQLLSMKVFGINEFAARFPNAICGIITLLVLFNIGKKLYDARFGILWAIAYAGSILPFFYFKSGIIDPWFNLFIFLSIYLFVLLTDNYNGRKSVNIQLILSALFIGLAIVTKGPVAILILASTIFIYWISKGFKTNLSFSQLFLFLIIVALACGLWFLNELNRGHYTLIIDFIKYQIKFFEDKDTGLAGFLLYHFIVLFFGVFPASILAFNTFKKSTFDNTIQRHFKRWMLILFWFVLILFTIVRTKILHYTSLCYFPLTYFGAYYVYKVINRQLKWSKYIEIVIVFIGSIIGLAVASLPLLVKNKEQIVSSGIITDEFIINTLDAHVHWNAYISLIGIFLIAGIMLSMYFMHQDKFRLGFILLFAVTSIFTSLTMYIIVPRIEKYSQNAAIEFYENLKGEDCYVETLGFKSYAQLFYVQKTKPKNQYSYSDNWLLEGNIDKPVYFVCKTNDSYQYFKRYNDLIKLYDKNGFTFILRYPKKKNDIIF